MSRAWPFLSALLLPLVGAACGRDSVPGASSPVDGTVIRFLHYNDFHAHLVAHTTRVLEPGDTAPRIAQRGGIARVATLIKRARGENTASVLMNIGDTYHGGVEALYTQGEAVAPIVNAMGIDVGVPGNWDYAYGPEVTRARYTDNMLAGMLECIQMGVANGALGGSGGPRHRPDGGVPKYLRPSYPNLAANVTYKTGPFAKPGSPFLPPTFVKDVSGVKVGFIGISSDIVPKMHPMLACGLTFLGAEDLASGDAAAWDTKYEALIDGQAASLRAAGAAIVVVMSELGLQKNFHLGNIVKPGAVDVFFSAHTHEAVFDPLQSKSGALVVEAGDDTYLGQMDIRVLNGKVVDRKWKLEPVTTNIPEDSAIKALVDEARAPFLAADPNLLIPGNTGGQLPLHEAIDKVIAHVAHPLDRKQALDSSFNDFFTEALRTKAGTQLGMAPGFRYDAPIATSESVVEGDVVVDGSVTVEDTYRFFPVVYTMATGTATGAQMKQVMESGMRDVFSTVTPLQGGGWLEGYAGLKVQVNLAAVDGSRVTSMTLPNGMPIHDADTLTIAGCRRPYDAADFLCSHGGFSAVADFPKGDGTVWTNIEILRDGLSRAAQLQPAKVLTDTSGTKLWPDGPFLQPLPGATGP